MSVAATSRGDMRREILQIPELAARLLSSNADQFIRAAGAIQDARPSLVAIVARGTSDHAAVYARYLLEVHLGIPVSLSAPSVTTIYGTRLRLRDAILIAISQSGEGHDVVTLCREAREQGAVTIAVTNEPSSALAQEADHLLDCGAGPEAAVPATKTYSLTLVAIAALVSQLAPDTPLARHLADLPQALADAVLAAVAWAEGEASDAFAASDRALVVSRGYNLSTALEIALKLKETAGLFAEGYSSADLLHGPIVLADPAVPVLVVRPDGAMGTLVDDAVEATRKRGTTPFQVGGHHVSGVERSLALAVDLPEALTPPVYALPGQLLAEAVARRRGLDPDRPEGLRKVTDSR
jgi:glucosamine--fructose-6-phosphate aminotransferase (isomerizing)